MNKGDMDLSSAVFWVPLQGLLSYTSARNGIQELRLNVLADIQSIT